MPEQHSTRVKRGSRPIARVSVSLDRSRRSRSYWLKLARKHKAAGDTSAVLHDVFWARVAHQDVMALILRGLSASLRAKAVRS